MASPLIGILMGSDSDLPTVRETCLVLSTFGVPYEVRVLSAHRSPEELVAYIRQAEEKGIQVFVAASGRRRPSGGRGGRAHDQAGPRRPDANERV